MILHGKAVAERERIGGKASGLFRLMSKGYPVPDFLVIPADTFDSYLSTSSNGIEAQRTSLLTFQLSIEDKEAVSSVLSSWNFPEQPVVVRSSVVDEDGEKDAFAGLMSSYLNLRNIETVYQRISDCAASAFSEQALVYREQKNLSLHIRPAVIIQKQVQAEVSGVVFSTSTEYPQEMAIHSVFGFGEALVSGTLEPDEFYLLKRSGTINRSKLALKDNAAFAGTEGLVFKSISEDLQNKSSLSEPQIKELFSICSAVERDFGSPQDIEFAFDHKGLYLLQVRPITQSIPAVVVYDNSNIQESYCGVTTPLTFSFASRAYGTVYSQTMKALGLPQKVIKEKEFLVNNLLGLVKGRIYYNINNWYLGLQLLPSFKQNKADMERMMGLQEPVDFIENTEKSFYEKVKTILRLVNLFRLILAFRKLPDLVKDFHETFGKHYAWFYNHRIDLLSYAELIKLKESLDRELLQNWTTPIVNDFYLMMLNGRVVRQLKKINIENPDEFLSRFLSGVQQIESMRPVVELQALAKKIAGLGELAALFKSGSEDCLEVTEERYPDVWKDFQAYIAAFGDRTAGELKLETETMRTNPAILAGYLRTYIDLESPVQNNKSNIHSAARRELEELLRGKRIKGVFKKLDKLQKSIQYRESLRLERTRLFGMYRTLYLAIGQILSESSSIENPKDVFYLTEDELLNAFGKELKHLVRERKEEFEGYRAEEVPARVEVPSPPVKPSEFHLMESGWLKGSGCSPGRVTGEIVVLTAPDATVNVRGKIICALRTDPGWAVIFPSCLAVLIEKGSSLSHSAIILRELQIPAIVNVPDLTRVLKTGQRVSLDASTGEIRILSDEG